MSEIYNLEYYKNQFGIKAEQTSLDNSISGMISDNMQSALDELKGTLGYSKKNLLPYPYDGTNASNNGITWTVNDDGTIASSGTSTGQSDITLKNRIRNPLTLQAGKYIVNGCPEGGSANTYSLLVLKTVGDTYEIVAQDFGEGATFELTEETGVGILCKVWSSGVTLDDTFKPMIRYASIEDDTYESYRNNIRDKFDQYGGLHYQNMHNSDSSYSAKPWLVLKDNYSYMEINSVYTGMINCSSTYSYIGFVYTSKKYASFIICGYQNEIYHAILQNGAWSIGRIAGTYTSF